MDGVKEPRAGEGRAEGPEMELRWDRAVGRGGWGGWD